MRACKANPLDARPEQSKNKGVINMKIRGQTVYSIQERLSRKSILNSKTGCIEWIGACRNGYGYLTVGSRSSGDRKTVAAHRIAYELYKGSIRGAMFVCHSCDNRKCINPDHLFVGTNQDNVNDRELKGRGNYTRKLSVADVMQIHFLKGTLTSKQISSMFNVRADTIKHIWSGRLFPKLNPKPPKAKE